MSKHEYRFIHEPHIIPIYHVVTRRVSPCGKKEIEDSQKFMIELLALILISTLTWAVFRFITKDIIGPINSISFNISYILVAPIVFLGPVMYYWVNNREEEGLPVRLFAYDSPQATLTERAVITFTPRMVKYVLIIAVSLTVVNFLLELILDWLTLNSGMYGKTEINFSWMEDVDSIFAYLILVFTYLAIVATVEEFFFRGFIQDQFSRRQFRLPFLSMKLKDYGYLLL